MSISKGNSNQIEAARRAVNGARTYRPPHHPQRNGATTQKIIKAKQKRLLMLKYAAECSMNKNTCGSTCARMHCHTMTKLWAHMRTCSDVQCTVKHCYSSRSVLTHYHRCVDKCCLICAPVKLLWSMQTGCMPGLLSKATPSPVCSPAAVQTPKKNNTTIHRRVTSSCPIDNDLEATNITPV